jgi:hypothetical protein
VDDLFRGGDISRVSGVLSKVSDKVDVIRHERSEFQVGDETWRVDTERWRWDGGDVEGTVTRDWKQIMSVRLIGFAHLKKGKRSVAPARCIRTGQCVHSKRLLGMSRC